MLAAQLVEGAPSGDLNDPALERAARRIETFVLLPERHEDILGDLLGRRRVQEARGDGEHERRVATVQRTQRVFVTPPEPRDERLVGLALGRVRRRWRG